MGVIPLANWVTAQHNHKTIWNALKTTKICFPNTPCLIFEKSHLPDCMCLGSPWGLHFTNPDWYTSVLDPTVPLQLSDALCSRPLNSQKPKGLSWCPEEKTEANRKGLIWAEHNATHLPFRSRCQHRVAGKMAAKKYKEHPITTSEERHHCGLKSFSSYDELKVT